jgi:hypothetical protein
MCLLKNQILILEKLLLMPKLMANKELKISRKNKNGNFKLSKWKYSHKKRKIKLLV